MFHFLLQANPRLRAALTYEGPAMRCQWRASGAARASDFKPRADCRDRCQNGLASTSQTTPAAATPGSLNQRSVRAEQVTPGISLQRQRR